MNHDRQTTACGRHNCRGRVLVADDDCDLRCYLAELLETAGYEAIQSGDGMEALRAFEMHCPHLAVIDLNMPVMSGYRLLRLLRRRTSPELPRMPVIVISGDDPQEAMDVVVETRPEAYLQKPFEAVQLVERVDALMALSA